MLFIAERNAGLAVEESLLCAIANGPDSVKTIASVMIETFIVISPFCCCCTIQISRCLAIEFLVAGRFKLRGHIMFRGWRLSQSCGGLKFFLIQSVRRLNFFLVLAAIPNGKIFPHRFN
jgi:hypothetical protein